MKCFYHTDMDGKCAGAIVYWHYKQNIHFRELEPTDMIPINYKDDFPFDIIKPDEDVVIVDFSLQKEGEFERLLKITDRITWIDHHKTAIEKHRNMQHLRGLRKDDEAGCVLTWKFYNSDKSIPRIVELLGDYDIWAFKFGEDTNKLQAGIRLYGNGMPPECSLWEDYFKGIAIDVLIRDGETALKYRDSYYQSLIKGWSFYVEFEGYKAICCNAGSVSSQLFDSVKEDYDLMIPFIFDGKQWTVSLYTKKKH